MAQIIFRRFIRRTYSAAAGTQLFGPKPGWWPSWLLFSPALLIVCIPAGFRLTCYYYRGAYYKAFWADPPACAVGEPRKGYPGERSFPLIMQNIHRYFLYLALLFIGVLRTTLGSHVVPGLPRSEHLGIGIGTIVLTLNVVLLGTTRLVAIRFAI